MKARTLLFGLIGYPLSHSLSPRLHLAALEAMHLNGYFQLYPLSSLQEEEAALVELLDRMRNNELAGLNVTIPHKQAILPFLDDITPTAKAIGAVNTIFSRDGLLVGENTDALGFLVDLDRFLKGNVQFLTGEEASGPRKAIVLGAGGAARAVTYGLICSGWEVAVAARRLEQAEELVVSIQSSHTNLQNEIVNEAFSTLVQNSPASIGSIATISLDRSSILNHRSIIYNQQSKIIINATPVGTWPKVDENSWPEEAPFPDGALVYDLIYNPPVTALMRDARRRGLPATNGLGMLIEQAALSLEIWTGLKPPRQSMWEAVFEYSGQTQG